MSEAPGGTIGLNQAAKAAPDGYTLVTATPSLTINPYIQKDIAFDPIKDFEQVRRPSPSSTRSTPQSTRS
jgi:tripartite-type tricarboxylate transporter receptor subunit TctC